MITLMSHGFKFSRPEANIVFDVSYFKNPWRDEDIRNEKDTVMRRVKAIHYMQKQEGISAFVEVVADTLCVLNSSFPNENFRVAFCCSAGEYRSPVIAELVSAILFEREVDTKMEHSKYSKI